VEFGSSRLRKRVQVVAGTSVKEETWSRETGNFEKKEGGRTLDHKWRLGGKLKRGGKKMAGFTPFKRQGSKKNGGGEKKTPQSRRKQTGGCGNYQSKGRSPLKGQDRKKRGTKGRGPIPCQEWEKRTDNRRRYGVDGLKLRGKGCHRAEACVNRIRRGGGTFNKERGGTIWT